MSHHTNAQDSCIRIKATGLKITISTVTGQDLLEVESEDFEYDGLSPVGVVNLISALCFQESNDDIQKAVAQAQQILSTAGQGKQQCASPPPPEAGA